MTRLLRAYVLFFALAGFSGGVTSAAAQQAGSGPPESGVVAAPDDGRRLGNVVNDQMRQFKMRRDCEMDLPECLPAIREIIEQERANRMWMGVGILAILTLLVLIAMREAEKKKKRDQKEWANHQKLGERIKHKWRSEVTDPYKDKDPLGDE